MPSSHLRRNCLPTARQLVVKLGTQVLTAPGGGLDRDLLARIAAQVAELRKRGIELLLVSSGAIGAGCAMLDLPRRPRDVADQQAVAAVGQRGLMSLMAEAFAPHGIEVAQLLLTRGDFDNRTRFLNIRNCISRLHAFKCLPIINENDTVATDELRFGDNDALAAMLTNLLRADALILLTTVPGLLDHEGRTIELVEDARDAMRYGRQDVSELGTGGIQSKLDAARMATDAGEMVIIADGREQDVLLRLVAGEKLGTAFVPAARKLDSRKRWIGMTRRPAGAVRIDEGAVNALVQRHKSLLASGIAGVHGNFDRGDVIRIEDTQGRELGRGLTNYNSADLSLIKGKRSNQFEKILGRPAFAEVIHRDNLVMQPRLK